MRGRECRPSNAGQGMQGRQRRAGDAEKVIQGRRCTGEIMQGTGDAREEMQGDNAGRVMQRRGKETRRE